MPQLNPYPWMMTYVFTWLAFLVLIPPKVLGMQFPNEPTAQSTEKSKMASWSWPWY